MYNRKYLESFLYDDVLIENILANQEVASIIENALAEDEDIIEDYKAILYKHILIIWFSILEASLRGFLMAIREECKKKKCKDVDRCKYCKSIKEINAMKFMSPIDEVAKNQKLGKIDFLCDYLKDVRMIEISSLEEKLFKLKRLRNMIHISNQTLEIDTELFNKETIDNIFKIIDELFDQMYESMRVIKGKEYGNGCLKYLDNNDYEFTRKINIEIKEKEIKEKEIKEKEIKLKSITL